MQIKPAPAACYRRPRVDETDHPVALERKRKLDKMEELRGEGLTVALALKAVDLPKSTFYEWRKSLDRGGVRALVPKSRRPHRCRGPEWTARDERLVLDERRRRPYCGKRRICHALREGGLSLSVSSVGRILSRAMRREAIRPCALCEGRVKVTRRRSFDGGHARRLRPGERAGAPGELVQVDHMTVSRDGQTLKEFRAVCPVTRRMLSRVCSAATAFNARRFLHALLDFMPVVSIQVDGGSEFMAEFEAECARSDIPLAVLPPRRPQLNGHVERANRTARIEFVNQYAGDMTVADANARLHAYLDYYNNQRPHSAIGMMTPSHRFATLQQAA